MALPITVPYTFGNATTAIPLSNLDSDYATVYQAVNGIGNGSVALANVTITGGTVSNVSGVVPTPFTANGVVYASSTSALATGSALTFDGTNLGVGVTPNAWTSGVKAAQIGLGACVFGSTSSYNNTNLTANMFYNSGGSAIYQGSDYASFYQQVSGQHKWFNAPSGTAGNAITFTQAMTLDASSNLLVGTTSRLNTERVSIVTTGVNALYTKNTGSDFNFNCWNSATTGDNQFIQFITEASPTARGSITYNRGAGVVAYNVTSDYRAKDILGPVTGSGALIDAIPVYMGKMKGATQERPMFIAHEVPAYAHTGEKDAVDADGNPVYQQMDASALIPVMWAEIQSLRKRILTLENK